MASQKKMAEAEVLYNQELKKEIDRCKAELAKKRSEFDKLPSDCEPEYKGEECDFGLVGNRIFEMIRYYEDEISRMESLRFKEDYADWVTEDGYQTRFDLLGQEDW